MLCVSFQFKKYYRACIYFTGILYHYCIVKVNYFSAFFLELLYTTYNAAKIITPTRKTQKLQSLVTNENNDIKPNAESIATKFPTIPTTVITAPIAKNTMPTQYRQSRFRSENFISSISPPSFLPHHSTTNPPAKSTINNHFFHFFANFSPTISNQSYHNYISSKKTPSFTTRLIIHKPLYQTTPFLIFARYVMG